MGGAPDPAARELARAAREQSQDTSAVGGVRLAAVPSVVDGRYGTGAGFVPECRGGAV